MGRPIVYCDGCGLSLREEEFDRGRAVTIQHRNFCAACKPADAPVSKVASSSRIPALGATPKRGTPAAGPFTHRKGSSSRIAIPTPKRGTPAARETSRAPMWIGITGAVLLLAVLAWVFSVGGPSPAPRPSPPPRGPAADPPKTARLPESEISKPPPEDPQTARQRQERFLADLEKAIENPRGLSRRKREILDMLLTAEKGGAVQEAARLRTLLDRRLLEESLGQGLVGHWKLDDAGGGIAKDSGPLGLDGVLKGSTSWGPGRIGGAIVLRGQGWIEIPTGSTLDRLNQGSYTISAWYKPSLVPPGKSSENDASHGIVIRSGLHVGPRYDRDGRIRVTDWLEGIKNISASGPPVPVGSFHHLVVAVDRANAQLRLHVNGVEVPPAALPPGSRGIQATSPWRIGVGHPEQKEYAWFAHGSIDDVRLYDRALAPEEAQLLFRQAP